MIPKDPNMLLSYINMGLRDKYSSFEDMAASEGFNPEEIKEKLEGAGYVLKDGYFIRLSDK